MESKLKALTIVSGQGFVFMSKQQGDALYMNINTL
jgi:hypothetical protein